MVAKATDSKPDIDQPRHVILITTNFFHTPTSFRRDLYFTQQTRRRFLLSPEELQKLRRHHNLTIGLFVAFWIYALGMVVAIELLELSGKTEANLIGTFFGAAIVLALVQFAKRCPKCRANLGWQVRLGVPKNCHKCGVALRADRDG